jgi:hypothetical protein
MMHLLDIPKPRFYTFHVSQFRSHIPPTRQPPDRVQWLADHGKAPTEIKDAHQKFINRALALIERDWSTLSADKALDAQSVLDTVCMRVWASITPKASDNDLVFFDPDTKSFWLYPA